LAEKARRVVSAVNGAHALVILLVEDEFLVRCNIANCLQDAGYVVVETASGDGAIEFCKSGMSIDIAFTDINLAGTASGWDVAECFRMHRPDVPVFYTSGKMIDPQRCVPGSVFVPKPYHSTDVLSACQRLRTK
jgi:two-component system, response regulator PdtaR